ncbi:uncharacterized protein K452DRAFT_319235 [Aplosporella prunicola CBS 121167]|uniref:Uncharacterized protein n=1 Tax=Aplosporella prunicola CBS 121167 TaxID=1176127 RepID=A0A6A6BDH1_9PEZI|nr:uncharacterized protein K452DRAFT_319235 [Aplosporella prunicola CBS 121167]KAF2140947.1 hypothetical protein K452DRAFT_319235 [Aplosporella prunicola CBS 121167]
MPKKLSDHEKKFRKWKKKHIPHHKERKEAEAYFKSSIGGAAKSQRAHPDGHDAASPIETANSTARLQNLETELFPNTAFHAAPGSVAARRASAEVRHTLAMAKNISKKLSDPDPKFPSHADEALPSPISPLASPIPDKKSPSSSTPRPITRPRPRRASIRDDPPPSSPAWAVVFPGARPVGVSGESADASSAMSTPNSATSTDSCPERPRETFFETKKTVPKPKPVTEKALKPGNTAASRTTAAGKASSTAKASSAAKASSTSKASSAASAKRPAAHATRPVDAEPPIAIKTPSRLVRRPEKHTPKVFVNAPRPAKSGSAGNTPVSAKPAATAATSARSPRPDEASADAKKADNKRKREDDGEAENKAPKPQEKRVCFE